MKFTNTLNYPKPLFNALTGDTYDLKTPPKNVISCTRLIGSPKIAELERRHWDDIVIPCESRIWVLLGTAVHKVLEQAVGEEDLSEERWYLNVRTGECFSDVSGCRAVLMPWYNEQDVFVTGKIDLYEPKTKTLYDFKQTSIYTWLLTKEPKKEWVQQLNINAMGMRKTGFEVEKVKIIAFYKDHAKKHILDGMPSPIHIIDLPLYSDDFVMELINEHIGLHIPAQSLPDDEIPVCTPEERWSRPTTWAVMKQGRKTALRVHDTEEQAHIHLLSCGADHRIEVRPGVDTRCVGYCNVQNWCNYYRDTIAGKVEVEPE